MDIIDMARASGLTVILDGRIGREEYQSVCGSVSALERFADSLHQCAAHRHDGAPRRSSAASVFGRWKKAALPLDRSHHPDKARSGQQRQQSDERQQRPIDLPSTPGATISSPCISPWLPVR